MTPRNRGPTTFAMSAVGTQPAFARTRSFESEMRAQRLSEAIKLRGLFHPRHSRFSSCATAASARSAGPPSPARSPRVRCCMGRPYKSRAASRCLGSAKMCSRRLTSVSDAMDGALRGIKVPRSVVQTADLGKGKAIACGNRQFYKHRFDRLGLYLSPICAIFVCRSL